MRNRHRSRGQRFFLTLLQLLFFAFVQFHASSLAKSKTAKGPNNTSAPAKFVACDEWQARLPEIRRLVISNLNELPDFLCEGRLIRQAFVDDDSYSLEEILAEYTYRQQRESCRILKVGNKEKKDLKLEEMPGATSIGEFAGSLRDLFAPDTQTAFQCEGPDTTRGKPTLRVGFYVGKYNSKSAIQVSHKRVTTAYKGRCWIALDSGQVVRLEDQAVDMPGNFPVTDSRSATDYNAIVMNGKSYWLPVEATMQMTAENRPSVMDFDFKRIYRSVAGPLALPGLYPAKIRTLNVMKFSKYRKFSAEVTIQPE